MNLKKRKYFTPKKKNSFKVILFLSSCSSLQTRTNLVLVKFTTQQFDAFWKLLENLQGDDRDANHSHSLSYWLLPNTQHKRISLNDNMFGVNTPDSSKICQKVEAFPY